MPVARSFTVLPVLPESLKDLELISRNMFWSWNPEFGQLFKRIDSDLWTACDHNPVKLLACVSQNRWDALSRNQGFLSELKQAVEKLNNYLNRPTWFEKVCSQSNKPIIAYFCAEFGIHECLAIYAGGLGILAGDHLKSASDLGVPVIGIGLLYQKGYFRQNLNLDGWQQEMYSDNDFSCSPVELVRDGNGRPITISIEYPGRNISAQIWSVAIGRVQLYLLDTNVADNSPADRMITACLYGGDVELRIRQEILLGIGGMRALAAMNLTPSVCHMNEGHAAFMGLERIRQLQNTNHMTFNEALETTKSSNVFTIHTPVKAGLDEFRVSLMDKYFSSYIPQLGISKQEFLSLGRIFTDDDNETYKMPILAMRLSGYINGVSKLHGEISRQMWAGLWPGIPVNEVPIISITNGVHIRSWVSEEICSLYDSYLDPDWADRTFDKTVWDRIDEIPDEQLWRIHQRCKEQLIVVARNRLKSQMKRRGTYHTEMDLADEVLDPEVLTIGFARRFVAYKRANLLLTDPQFIVKMLCAQDRPIQIIFAGKAHPMDMQGKDIIKQVVHFARQKDVRKRIVFLEDYDIDLARVLVRGVDVWLNNPRRPMEASGTSGMKAALNGILNISTLDGWWSEGYTPKAGWLIGSGEGCENHEYQDQVESQALYNLLENDVVPLFYTRSGDNLPRAWIRRMKDSIKWIAPRFNTNRMIAEYTRRFYNPAAARWRYFTADTMVKAKEFTKWKADLKRAWGELSVKDVKVEVKNGQGYEPMNLRNPKLKVGTQLSITALIKLGRINPSDVSVELYHGPTDSFGDITGGCAVRMEHKESSGHDGEHWFNTVICCRATGRHGLTVRILPRNPDMTCPYEPGLILWESAKTK